MEETKEKEGSKRRKKRIRSTARRLRNWGRSQEIRLQLSDTHAGIEQLPTTKKPKNRHEENDV